MLHHGLFHLIFSINLMLKASKKEVAKAFNAASEVHDTTGNAGLVFDNGADTMLKDMTTERRQATATETYTAFSIHRSGKGITSKFVSTFHASGPCASISDVHICQDAAAPSPRSSKSSSNRYLSSSRRGDCRWIGPEQVFTTKDESLRLSGR